MPAPTLASLRPRFQLSTAAAAGLLQLGLWVVMLGFYFAWNNRPNFSFSGPIWPLVLLQMGFAVLLFNALVYLIIPHWLLRGHYGRALLGAVGLLYAFQLWAYTCARLALAFLPLDAVMRRTLHAFYVADFWTMLLSPFGQLQVLMGMLAVFLFPVLISFLAYTLVVERRRLHLERHHLALELGFLKSQINPQFLFHTLGSLLRLTQTRDARAPDVVLHLADLMRYTLYETDAERVPLARELEFLEDYLALERLRRPATVEIAHTVSGEATTQQLAPLLLHPFLERLFAPLDDNDDDILPEQPARFTSHVQANAAAVGLILTRTSAAARPPSYRTEPAVAAALRRLALQYPGRHTAHISEAAHTLRVEIHIELA
ncbi:sensor histidine kinase [Hymenobacter terrestris]|uniref:Histidine kinase n=1 Tax=Hymenobacter terrestris TaxID=2748310 RepID=A0ABX2Q305_9BACT|nr:histidine kinase [Hymenobacter terrestris]NVO84391.1 histidine kinase [Hymenobacter terrestris]